MEHSTSLFEQLFVASGRRWWAIAASVVLGLIPFAGLALATDPGALMQVGRWRGLLVAPAMIIYVTAVAAAVEGGWMRVCSSLRTVVKLDDEAYSWRAKC